MATTIRRATCSALAASDPVGAFRSKSLGACRQEGGSDQLRSSFLVADYVDCVEPFGALLALKIYHVALVEGLESILLNGREMHKNIFAGRALDKSIALGPVKPLHYATFSHKYFPSFIVCRMRLWEGWRDRSGSFESALS